MIKHSVFSVMAGLILEILSMLFSIYGRFMSVCTPTHQVNDTNLIGLENMAAAAVLRNAGRRVRLVIGRRRNQLTPDIPSSSASGVDLFGATVTRSEETTPSSSRESESSPAVDDSIYGKKQK